MSTPSVRELRRELLTSTTPPHGPLQREVAMPGEAAYGEEAPAGAVLNKGQNLLGDSPARGEAEGAQGRGDRRGRVMPRQRPPPPSVRELRRQWLPRALLSRQESAVYLGIGEKLFARLVYMGRAPPPKVISTGRSMVERWDIVALDQFIDALPGRGETGRTAGAHVRRVISL
jgi:hypothetical protein